MFTSSEVWKASLFRNVLLVYEGNPEAEDTFYNPVVLNIEGTKKIATVCVFGRACF